MKMSELVTTIAKIEIAPKQKYLVLEVRHVTRLLHASYTPLTCLLHASYTHLLHASYTHLLHASYTHLLHASSKLVALELYSN